MKQFYETYRDNTKLSPLVKEIGWTNNMIIVGWDNVLSALQVAHACATNGVFYSYFMFGSQAVQ